MRKLYHELVNGYADAAGVSPEERLQFMKLKRFDRIVEALEGIEDKLSSIDDSLEALSSCVGYVPPTVLQKEGYHILRIGGHIDTSN